MQTNTNNSPTQGQKIVFSFFIILLLGGFVNFINIKANNGVIESIPIYESALYFSKSKSNSSAQVSSQKFQKEATNPAQNLPISELKEVSQSSQKEIRIDEIGVFVNNENKADLITKTKEYIKKYQKSESPLDAEILVNLSQKTNFPLDLILIQLHQENHFCTNGGDRLLSKNCFNVGNNDKGDNKPLDCNDGSSICLESYEKGLDLYINYMKSCHFHENEIITSQKFFDRDFRQVRQGSKICGGVGKRYATDPSYRQNLATILQNNFNPIFSK